MVAMDFSGPWGTTDETATPFFQDQVRLTWGGWAADGLTDIGVANPAKITATGSDTTVTVEAFSGVVRGITLTLDANTALDVEGFGGTTPTSGKTRIDRVIIQMDFAAKTAVLIVSCGTPATSGAVAATLTQDDDLDGIWEHELGQVRRVGNVAVTNTMITNSGQRIVAPAVYLPPGVSFSGKANRGTIIVTDTDIQVRRRATAGTPASLVNRSLLDPPWTPATLASTVYELFSAGRTPQWRVVGGLLQLTCSVHKKTGSITTNSDTWSTVATIPVASLPSIPNAGIGDGVVATHLTAHNPTGASVAWRLVAPASGNAVLQVLSVTNTSLAYVNLALFSIPTGA